MEITYLGHSSFKIKGKEKTIITDPFDPSMVGIAFPKVSADLVLVSHQHPDHAQSILVDDVQRTISGAGEYEIGGVSIIGLPTFHDDKKGAERGKNIVYIIEIDGLCIVHLGDLGHTLSEETLDEFPEEVDVLMVPVGGVYTIDAKTAVDVVRGIEPKYILPMHFKASAMNQENFGSMSEVSEFVAQIGMTPESTPKLLLKEGSLAPEQKLILLERK